MLNRTIVSLRFHPLFLLPPSIQMSIPKIAPNSDASAILQVSGATQFANYFSNLAKAVDSGDLGSSRTALAELLKATAFSLGTGMDAINQSSTFRQAFDALRNEVRSGDTNAAQAALANLRQTFGAPVDSVAGTDLRNIKVAPSAVAGTDLRAIQIAPGMVAGTDLRAIKTTPGAIGGTDFHAINTSKAPTGAIAGTDLRTIKTTPSSIAGTNLGA